MAAPLTRCVVCFEELTLAELAHSPCKHCHIEFCNECLTRAFEIAQRDDVLEVHCPNPHCRRLLNAESMQIQATTLQQWVKEELLHKKYGILTQYEEKNWDSADIVRYIINTRKRDLTHVRRKSSVWEEQLTKLKLRAKADLADVPLAPILYTNASTDRIDLRSKFTSKMTRSQSVPNVNVADKTIQMFKSFADEECDEDDLETDTDFSDSEEEEVTQPTATAHRRLINAIIDEDQELNDCQYHSPMNSEVFTSHENISCHSSPYDRTSPYMNSILSKKSSDMTMISISESSQTCITDHTTNEGISPTSNKHLSPTSNKQKSTRISATFKALFSNKAVSADVVSIKKKKRRTREAARSRGQSDQNRGKLVQHRRRSGSNRILDIFAKHKEKKKSPKYRRRKTDANKKAAPKRLQKTASSRNLSRKHAKSSTLDLENIRSITPDPYPSTEFRRSHSQTTQPISPPPPQQNQLSLSYQKQLMQINIKNKKKQNISHRNPPARELKKPNPLPSLAVTLKAKSAPTESPPMNRLSTDVAVHEVSTSELSTSVSGERPASPDMNKLPALDRFDIHSNSRSKPCLAPINSLHEVEHGNDEQLSMIVTPKSNEIPHDDDDDEDMARFDINVDNENDVDINDESTSYSLSITDEEIQMQVNNDTDDDRREESVNDNDLEHVPHTFMTETATATTNTNTNTNTMPIPATPDFLPMCSRRDDLDADDADIDELPPIRMSIGMNMVDIAHKSVSEPHTPDTPPTPNSPNSGSMTSNNSHYEHMMRNFDSAIARQTETTSTQTNSNSNANNNNKNHKHHDTPPSHNEADGAGCNGCHACIIL